MSSLSTLRAWVDLGRDTKQDEAESIPLVSRYKEA